MELYLAWDVLAETRNLEEDRYVLDDLPFERLFFCYNLVDYF